MRVRFRLERFLNASAETLELVPQWRSLAFHRRLCHDGCRLDGSVKCLMLSRCRIPIAREFDAVGASLWHEALEAVEALDSTEEEEGKKKS